MASLSKSALRGKVSFRIQFLAPNAAKNDPRLGITLGIVDEEFARSFKSYVETIIDDIEESRAHDKRTRAWLGSLEDAFHAKLSECGLVEPRVAEVVEREDRPLSVLIERYLATITRKKPRTQVKLKQAGDCLVRYFKADRQVDSITAGHAEEWVTWLASSGNNREGRERKDKDGKLTHGKTSLSESTVRRRSGLCKQILEFAVKLRWIKDNPFRGLVSAVGANEERMFFVDHPTINRALKMAPDATWKGIIALARFGGLRIPSELTRLRWCDIEFETGVMTIHATKTEHHKGKGIRQCPIFPELRPYLEDLSKLANVGIDVPITEPVFPNLIDGQNIRKGFERMLKKAGIRQWPKLFQNLRASRETELLALYPAKDVCSWIGNTQAIAMKHYAMPTEESFQRALRTPTVSPVLHNTQTVVQNSVHSGAITSPYEESPILTGDKKTAENLEYEGVCGSVRLSANVPEMPFDRRRGTRTPDIHGVNVTL